MVISRIRVFTVGRFHFVPSLVICCLVLIPFSDCFAYTIRESSVLEKIRKIDSLPVGHTAIVFNEFDQRIYAASRSSQEIFRIEANSNAGGIGSLIGNSNDDSAIAASFETGDLFATNTSAGRVMRYDQNLNWNQILVNSDLTSYEDDQASIFILPQSFSGDIGKAGQGIITDRNDLGEDYIFLFNITTEPSNLVPDELTHSALQPRLKTGYPVNQGGKASWTNITTNSSKIFLLDDGSEGDGIGQGYHLDLVSNEVVLSFTGNPVSSGTLLSGLNLDGFAFNEKGSFQYGFDHNLTINGEFLGNFAMSFQRDSADDPIELKIDEEALSYSGGNGLQFSMLIDSEGEFDASIRGELSINVGGTAFSIFDNLDGEADGVLQLVNLDLDMVSPQLPEAKFSGKVAFVGTEFNLIISSNASSLSVNFTDEVGNFVPFVLPTL